jgi:hypothetical protein
MISYCHSRAVTNSWTATRPGARHLEPTAGLTSDKGGNLQSIYVSIFLMVSATASIVSLLIGLWKYRRLYQVLNTLLVVALTVFSAYSFFEYQKSVDHRRLVEEEKADARLEAGMLSKRIVNRNYFNPGQCRGIVFAGLAFLEQHQNLYPATYTAVSRTALKDIEYADQHSGTQDEEQRLKTSAESMVATIWSLAGPEAEK